MAVDANIPNLTEFLEALIAGETIEVPVALPEANPDDPDAVNDHVTLTTVFTNHTAEEARAETLTVKRIVDVDSRTVEIHGIEYRSGHAVVLTVHYPEETE